MPIGTLGFIGKNLKEAREVRCLSVVSLAELAGISKASIYQYETGEISPTHDVVQRLANHLNFPEEFFFKEWEDEPDEKIFFRSLAADTRTAKKRAAHRLRWLKRITFFLSRMVNFPKVNLPNWNMPNFREMSNDDIEDCAMDLRSFWGLGENPIGNVVWLLENNGFIVSRSELIAPKQDALSSWSSQCHRPIMILGNDKASCVRSRFDACHELGHLILHQSIEPSILAADNPDFKLIEKQAHYFASAFLFPRKSFVGEVFLVRLEALIPLKQRWKISIATMVKRAHDLELIDDEQATRLWRSINRRDWRKCEPLDDSIPFEEPVLLTQAVEALLQSGQWTSAGIRSEVPLPVTDMENLICSEHGLLDERKPTVQILDPADWANEG